MTHINRRKHLNLPITLLLICIGLNGCQSQIMEALKPPNSERRQALTGDTAQIQLLFADAGLNLYPPNLQARQPRYRCQTRSFEIFFAAVDAELALELATHADGIYERLKAWYQFGLPYRVKVRIESTGSPRAESLHNLAGRTAGAKAFYLNSTANPTHQTFAHELAHLFFYRQREEKPTPWWLDEGLPEYVSIENRGDAAFQTEILGKVGAQAELLQLANLPVSDFPLWQSYRAALSFFLYLDRQYGEEKVQATIRQFIRAPSIAAIEDMILLVYGKPLSVLEREWQNAARSVASSQ